MSDNCSLGVESDPAIRRREKWLAIPPLIYGAVVWFISSVLTVRIDSTRLTNVGWLCGAALVAPALTAPVSTGFLYLTDRLPLEVFGAATISFWVGDAVGILMLAPPLIFAWLFITADRAQIVMAVATGLGEIRVITNNQTVGACIEIATILALTIALSWITGFQGDTFHWYPAFLPMIWLSLRFGWLGAISSIFVLNLLAAWVAADLSDPSQRIDLQLFLIVLSVTGIFLGAIVSDRTRVERLNAERLAELAQADRLNSLGELAAGIVHEIGQPLSTLSIYAQEGAKRMEAHELSNSEIKTAFGQFVDQTDRMNRIVLGVQRLGRKVVTPRAAIDLNQSIRSVSRLLEIEAKKHDARIQLSLNDNVPKISCNPIQIEQVILNVGRNGIQAMAEIQPAANRILTIRSFVDGNKVAIAVTDAGKGLDVEELEQVFEPFYSAKDGGHGLGLSISKSIITEHGGDIQVKSSPGDGATFTVLLPARDAS